MSGSGPAVFVISGCSSGLGKDLALAALEKGYRVIATARKIEALDELKSKGASTLHLDVTAPEEELQAFAERAIRVYGHVDVLINNAGWLQGGALEEISLEQARSQFDSLFFGVFALTNAFLPHFRQRRSGTIINISSQGALLNIAGGGIYCAAKAAVDSASDVWAQELAPWGVKVTAVTLGAFRTAVGQPGRTPEPAKHIEGYDGAHAWHDGFIAKAGTERGDVRKAAERLVDLATLEGPFKGKTGLPKRFPLGDDAVENVATYLEAQKSILDEWGQFGAKTDVDGFVSS
ncbi:hypothetical protein PLICRDRAFT_130690 [Plicaturopsis crispa FD-325 SS-3]|nr:hypothetical protein PLICRDRAFT_130690 [Plicaturopsis crispa FD-325 SS-3]